MLLHSWEIFMSKNGPNGPMCFDMKKRLMQSLQHGGIWLFLAVYLGHPGRIRGISRVFEMRFVPLEF